MSTSITAKLFIAVLATAMLVALAMGVAAHLNLKRGFLGYLNEQAVMRLDQAVPSVTAGYQRHGSWDFLRERPELWYRLLRPIGEDAFGVDPQDRPPPTVSELTGAVRRFTLYDAGRQRIAGFERPSPTAFEREIRVGDRTVGWLAMTPFQSVSSDAERRFSDAQLHATWAVGLGALVMAALVALWASRRLLAPVKRVAAATHRLAAGDYDTRVHVDGDDEVAGLAVDFNRLAHTLKRNEQMRREFMADVSHELRTPLGVLHGELEAMEDGVRRLDRESLRSLQAEVGTLNKLVSDLYDLSLADVGALAYRKVDLDLVELLRRCAVAWDERLASRGLRLEIELPATPLQVFADESRLQQLFGNLIENSCRYTDAGGRLRIVARRSAGEVQVDLMDSAPGVAAEHLARIFDRFFRVEGSRNRSSGGAGLGLAIVSRIVEAHDGRIEARVSPLGGLWIALALPVAKGESVDLSLPAGGARILVVEDEPKMAALVSDYLRQAGHEPQCLADGREVVPAFRRERHDLILLDLMLPGRDGLDVCRELRRFSDVPIVMLTARAEEAERLLGLELGADDYISKTPFSPREIVARVKAILRRSRRAGTPAAPAVEVDEDGYRAWYRGTPLDLTPIEFRLLKTLASSPGRVYSRDLLLDHLHADQRAVTDRAVDSHVKNLRRKLEQAQAPADCIRSIYGVGYRLDA